MKFCLIGNMAYDDCQALGVRSYVFPSSSPRKVAGLREYRSSWILALWGVKTNKQLRRWGGEIIIIGFCLSYIGVYILELIKQDVI